MNLTDREAQLLEAHESGQHEHRESGCPECECECGYLEHPQGRCPTDSKAFA
jgi:hypothetical protein